MTSFPKSYLAQTREVAERLDIEAIERVVAELVAVRAREGRLFILGVGGGAGHASHAVRRNLARASQCLVHGLCPWSRPRWRLLPSVPAFWTAPYPTEQRRSAFAWWRDIERALRMAR